MGEYRALLEDAVRQVGPASFSFDDLSRRRDRKRRAQRRTAIAVASVVAVVGIGTLVYGWGSGNEIPAGPGRAFVGTWESIDLDRSEQKMTIMASGAEIYEVTVADEHSTACGGASATAVGTGRMSRSDTMTITQIYTCQDGRVIREVEGIRLDNWFLIHDPASDTLTDPTGVVWYQEGTEPRPPPDGATTRTAETSLGTWTWTWIPQNQGASRVWAEAEARWHAEGSLGEEFGRWLAAAGHEDWLGWHMFTSIPWVQADGTTVIAVGDAWNLVVDTGDGYRLLDAPWADVPLFAFDVAGGPEGFVAVGLRAEGVEEPGSFEGPHPGHLHRWGSADGLRWRELGRPAPVGDVFWHWIRLVGDDERLLLMFDAPETTLWTSATGADWRPIGSDLPLGMLEGGPARTSHGWILTSPHQTDWERDLWRCDLWVSPDATTWERVPFHHQIENRPLVAAGDCRVFEGAVYVLIRRIPDQEGEPTDELDHDAPPPLDVDPQALGLWIGQPSD